jgi:hypothetical protein
MFNDETKKKTSLKKEGKNQANPNESSKPGLISQTYNA